MTEYDFSDFELHPDNSEQGQCNRCDEMFPIEKLSIPDAICEKCMEIINEDKT